MADQPSKTCIVCGLNCAGQRRTKDAKGRYYHSDCYEQRKQEMQAKQSTATPVDAPVFDGLGGDDDGGFDPFDGLDDSGANPFAGEGEPAAAVARQLCPGCRNPVDPSAVLCTSCGYDMRTGGQMQIKESKEKAPRESGALAARLKSPPGVGSMVLAAFGIFALIAKSDESLIMGFVLAAGFYMAAVNIAVLVASFMHGALTGILTMFVPFYALYFLHGINENRYLRWLFWDSVLIYGAGAALFLSNIGQFAEVP